MSLEAFMIDNKEEVIEYIASNRFKDKSGNPVPWKLKTITAEENQAIRKDCYIKVQVTGKRGQFTKDFDSQKYLGLLAEKCIVYPDLHSKELQDFYKTMGASSLLGKLLKPGEFDDLTAKLEEINGYTLDNLVEEAKN